jgi:hypothetical protein
VRSVRTFDCPQCGSRYVCNQLLLDEKGVGDGAVLRLRQGNGDFQRLRRAYAFADIRGAMAMAPLTSRGSDIS